MFEFNYLFIKNFSTPLEILYNHSNQHDVLKTVVTQKLGLDIFAAVEKSLVTRKAVSCLNLNIYLLKISAHHLRFYIATRANTMC